MSLCYSKTLIGNLRYLLIIIQVTFVWSWLLLLFWLLNLPSCVLSSLLDCWFINVHAVKLLHLIVPKFCTDCGMSFVLFIRAVHDVYLKILLIWLIFLKCLCLINYLWLLLIGLQCEYVISGQHKSGADWYSMVWFAALEETLQFLWDWQLWQATTQLSVRSFQGASRFKNLPMFYGSLKFLDYAVFMFVFTSSGDWC